MEIFNLFSAFGLAASSGLNAYIPLLTISLLAKFTNLIKLQSPWDNLTSWWFIGILAVLTLIEFFADSSPLINHVNDLIQSFVRPVAGAVAFAATAQVINEIQPVFALLIGLVTAGGVHTVKAAVIRPAVTATTGGTANVAVAMAEDATALGVSLVSIIVPVGVVVLLMFLIVALLAFFNKKP